MRYFYWCISFVHNKSDLKEVEILSIKTEKYLSQLYIENMKSVIENIMDENIFNPQLSVDFMAKKAFISTSFLYRCCVYNFGKAPSDYISDSKLKKACEMIMSGGFTLCEISNNLNFCSQAYFSARFKKKYGISPKDYRFFKLKE